MKNVFQKVVFSLFLVMSVPTHVSASDLPDGVKGFAPQALEVYFDRADQERADTDWQRVARFGAEACLSDWERSAALLYTDPAEMAQARAQLTSWVGGHIQERFETWLMRGFFDKQGSLGVSAVREAIAEANLQYLYTTDSAGNVQFDSNGDPVLRGADGLSTDRESWRARVHKAEDELMAAWGQRVDQAFAPELGALLGPDGLSRYQDCKVVQEAGIRREMERVALQAELSLASRRLYDQYSLRRKSESATADAIADQIVGETRAQTDAGIQQLQACLSLTPESVDSSVPTIDVEKWKASFTAAFDAGLSRWDEAEQKFLAGRMEWEQDAGASYAEGEQAWAAGFQRLQDERKAWEKQVDALLEAGSARWDEQREDLSAAIDAARTEFQKERDERTAAMQDEVGALVDMYAQAQQVLATAAASGQALLKRFDIRSGGEIVNLASDSAADAISQFRRDEWSGCIAQVNGTISALGNQAGALRSQASSLQGDLSDLADDISRFLNDWDTGVMTIGTNTITVTSFVPIAFGATATQTITADTSSNKLVTTTTWTIIDFQTGAPRNITDTTTTMMPSWESALFAEYIQKNAELTQTQTNRDDIGKQIAPLESLVTAMGAVEAGLFRQGEDPGFADARKRYGDYLGQQSPFERDVFQEEWERLNRLADWLDIMDTYRVKADEARQKLQEALGTAFGTDAADLRDVLKTDGESGIAYLDEYQLELLRAKAVQDYWTQKKNVADAVVAYAQDLTSGRQTEDQSEKAYEAAQHAYEDQLASCNRVMAQLQAGGMDLAAARQALDDAQKAADDASAQYQDAYTTYLQALVATQSGSKDFYLEQIKEKYSDLLAASGMTDSDTQLTDAATAYFAAARHYGYDLAAQDAWGDVQDLIHGDPPSGVPSLDALKKAAGAILAPGSADAIPSAVEQLGVAEDSPQFARVSALYSAWKDAEPGAAKELAGWKMIHFLGLLKAEAHAACDARLAEIKAYGAVDPDEWYAECGGQRAGGALSDRLSADSLAAQLALIAARAAVEMTGLEAWLQLQSGQAPADADAERLARSAPSELSRDEAGARIAALQRMEEALREASSDPSGAAARLRDMVQGGGWIHDFVAGNGTFVDGTAGDLVTGLCALPLEEAARANGLLSAWNHASGSSTALAAEREAAAIASVKEVFAAHGFSISSDGALPASESVAARLGSEGAAGAVTFVADLNVELSQACSAGPQWLQDRIREYTDSLAGYAVAAAARAAASPASTRAANATSAAAAAAAGQSELRSLSAALSGPGRLAALADLSTRSDPPSASAVAVRSLVVESAAVRVAERSREDRGQTLEQIVAGLLPGVPVAVSGQIALRASQLLQTSTGAGVIGDRIAEYSWWSTVNVNDSVTGITINPLASEAQKLWETLQAEPVVSDAVNAYLGHFGSEQVPEEIVQLCDALVNGVVSRDELFRTFLFGQGFDSLLASFDPMGAAGDVYRRAAVLRIASRQDGSDEGRSLARFLRDRTGISNASDAEDFAGMGADADVGQEALAGGSGLSLEYLCKSLLLQGTPLSAELSTRLAASPSVGTEVASFEVNLRDTRGYLPVLDGSPHDYAAAQGGDLPTQSARAASLSTGQWDDELFCAMSGSGYLEWYESVIDATLDSAVPVIQGELAQNSSSCGRVSYQRTIEAAYWRQVQDQEDAPDSWRWYLDDSNVGTDAAVGAAAAQTRDDGGYARDPIKKENAVLDAFNDLAQQEKSFAQQLAARSGDATAFTKFHDFLCQLVAGAADEADVPGPSEQGLQTARDTYQAALSRIQGLKEDIRRSGAALELLNSGTEERQAVLDKAKMAVEDLTRLVTTTRNAASDALTAFETSGNSYNLLCAELHSSENTLEQTRLGLRVQQEIRDWACNGYLASSGESVTGYQSPRESQQEAAQHLAKAAAALDVLKGLFGATTKSERPLTDAAALSAYEAWRSSYSELMTMERVSGELNAAARAQQDKVQDLTNNLDQARNAILDGSCALNILCSMDENSRLKSWAGYLVVQDGKLRLNVASDYSLSAPDDQGTVKNFFQKKGNEAGSTAFEQQMTAFVDYVADHGTSVIDRWGLAADWLKLQLFKKGDGNIREMVGSAYESETGLIGDQKWLDFQAAGEHTDEVGTAWAPEAYSVAGDAFNQVMADSEEKTAFEFYFAMRAATGREGADLTQFHTRTSSLIMGKLQDYLARRYQHYKNLAQDHGWFSGVLGSQQDRDAYKELLDECRNTIDQFDAAGDSKALQSGMDAFMAAEADLGRAKDRLAELAGSNNKPLASINDFIAQYEKLESELTGTSVSVDANLEAQFRKAWESLKTEDKESFRTALQKMTVTAQVRNADAEIEVRAALAKARSDSSQAQQDYLSVYGNFLEGKADEQSLRDTAAAAYRDSAWVARTEHELTSGVLAQAAFTSGPLTDVETQARMTALEKYAQSAVAAYAGSLDARGSAAEQAWSQSTTDLGDQVDTWKAQVGLMRAKATSAWDASQEKLAGALTAWRQGFQQQYAAESDAWRLSYLNFGEQKLQWVQEAAAKASQAGNEAILSEVGASADDAMRSASTPMIATMGFDRQEANLQVEVLLSQVGSPAALNSIRRVNSGIAASQVMVASAGLRVDTGGARIAAEVKRFLEDSREQMAGLAAREIADQAQDSVVQARKALADSVKKANEGFGHSMDYTFANAGYATSGGSYQRQAIVRTTFADVITERQDVEGYRPYAMPVVQIAVDLSQERLKMLPAEAVMDLVGVAQQEVSQAQKKIFGEGKELSAEDKRKAGLLIDFSANDTTVTKELGEGEFGRYIGYAPEFSNEPDFDRSQDRNIVVRGSGELGRMMGDFVWNQMKEGRGWSEMALPRWDQPLWDDTGSCFKAPTLRSVGTIAAGVAAAVLVPGGGALTLGSVLGSAAISTSATVAFDALDVQYGFKSWEEAGLDVGKQFLSNVAAGAINGSGLFSGGQGAIDKAVMAGAQTFTTNIATNAIDSFNLHGGWGMGFDTRGFFESSFGESALTGVATSAVGAGVTSGLGDWNMQDGNGRTLSDNVFNVGKFNGFVGGLTSSAVEYGLTGQTTLNVVRLSGNAVDGSQWSSGLLELHVGGDLSMNFGTGGTDISLGTIAASLNGIQDMQKIGAAKARAASGDYRDLATVNALNMLGYTSAGANWGLAKDIWSGEKKLGYYDATTAGVTDQDLQALGYAEGTDTIGINATLMGSGVESAAQIASLMAHEGMHLAGKGEIDAKIGGYSAYSDLMATVGVTGQGYEETGIAGSARLLREVGASRFAFVASAQIAAEGESTGSRQYEQAAVTDRKALAQASLIQALGSTNAGSYALQVYLSTSENGAELLEGNEEFNKFTAGQLSSAGYEDAYSLLNGLRDALRDASDSEALIAGSIYNHDMLQYTTKVFTGTNGYNGLSGALYMANLASDDAGRAGNASGYLINDVARTYEGHYLNINYAKTGAPTGDEVGSQYFMNFVPSDLGYGQAVTGYFEKKAKTGNWEWTPSTQSMPSLDCIGYVNLALYASGALKAGQALNQEGFEHKVAVAAWSKEYVSAYTNFREEISGSVHNEPSNTFAYGWSQLAADRKTLNGLLPYADDRLTWSEAPQIGSLVFMKGHIGIYGVNDDAQNVLIHSAPQYMGYDAGPRENLFGSWTDSSLLSGNDKYTNMLVANGYFSNWKRQLNQGYNFATVKPWWMADSSAR